MQTSIPVNHLHAATQDKALRKLLRAQQAAAKRVAQALDDQAEADGAVADYVTAQYCDEPKPGVSVEDGS